MYISKPQSMSLQSITDNNSSIKLFSIKFNKIETNY